MQKSKQGTARIALYRIIQSPNIFTLETSFFKSSNQEIFNAENLFKIGQDFCKALLIYFQDDLEMEGYKDFRLETFHKNDLIKELYIMPKKDIVKIGMEESSGSDSNPSDDNLEEVFLNTIT